MAVGVLFQKPDYFSAHALTIEGYLKFVAEHRLLTRTSAERGRLTSPARMMLKPLLALDHAPVLVAVLSFALTDLALFAFHPQLVPAV